MKLGLSTCAKVINEELFRDYQNAGITHMEISGKDEMSTLDYQMIGRLAQKYNICLWSCHLPFWAGGPKDIASLDDNERMKVLNYHVELMKKTAAVGIRIFVLHPSWEPIPDEARSQHMEKAKESIMYLADQAQKLGGILAVENLPRSCLGNCSDEILELVSVHPNAYVCFDTNHLLNETPEEFAKKVGKKIVTTHVSDYDFVDERHWLPGEGKIDWRNLHAIMHDIDSDGMWLYELGFECPETLHRDRFLDCKDIARNADEIFNGKKFTILSKPTSEFGA